VSKTPIRGIYAFIMHPAYALEEKVTTTRIGYQAQGVVSWTGCG